METQDTRDATITAYPYAVQYGTLAIPKDITEPNALQEYVNEHWNEIDFSEPDLDYSGTDVDIDF